MGTKRENKKQSPENKTFYWIKKLPICLAIFKNQLLTHWTIQPPIVPTLDVKFQIADTGAMHLQIDNILWYGDRFAVGKNNWRGTRKQFAIAVGQDGKTSGLLRVYEKSFGKREDSPCLKDIFANKGSKDNTVKEIYWVTIHQWYESPTPECANPGNPNFGKELKAIEIEVIIFRKPRNKSFAELIEQAEKEKQERETAHLRFPANMRNYPGIKKALAKGYRMHGFSSGGGLRVVELTMRCETSGITYSKGYGEHPHIEEALEILNEDYLAGGRPYKEVYGKLYPHYLTGDTIATSNIDWWLRKGSTFDCWMEDGQVVFQLAGLAETTVPPLVIAAVEAEGKPVRWTSRGFTFKTEPYVFPSGKKGTSTQVVARPAEKENRPACDSLFYYMTKTGYGKNFWEAMKAAFDAPEVEVNK